jgi:hypothetical protein
VSLDGRPLDVLVTWPDGSTGRPAMHVLVDVATGFVAGHELAASENAVATARLIRGGTERFRIPDTSYADSGSALAGHLPAGGVDHKWRGRGKAGRLPLPGVCAHPGIHVTFALPKTAQGRERLPGRCGLRRRARRAADPGPGRRLRCRAWWRAGSAGRCARPLPTRTWGRRVLRSPRTAGATSERGYRRAKRSGGEVGHDGRGNAPHGPGPGSGPGSGPGLVAHHQPACRRTPDVVTLSPEAPPAASPPDRVPIPTAQDLPTSIRLAHKARDLTMIPGRPGVGRTAALRRFCAEAADAAYLSLAPGEDAPFHLAERLRTLFPEQGDFPINASNAWRRETLERWLADTSLTICFDEAQNAGEVGLDWLRMVCEGAGIGAVFAGSLDLATLAGTMPQPVSRMARRCIVKNVTPQGVAAPAVAHGLDDSAAGATPRSPSRAARCATCSG